MIFGILVSLLVIAVVIFATTFDINNYKSRITQAVKNATGRTLTVDGDIRLSYFPTPGVVFQGLNLSNAEGFHDDSMVKTGGAQVSVRLLPLLMGDIRFGRLYVDNLSIHLERKEDGSANWDDLVGRVPVEEAEVEKQVEVENFTFELDIDGVTLRNADFHWTDSKTDVAFVVRGINVETGRLYEGAPAPVKADLQFQSTEPELSATVSVSGKFSFDLANREYGHMDVLATVEAEGQDIPGGKQKGELGVKFAVFDFKKDQAQITGLKASAYGVTANMDSMLTGVTEGVEGITATVDVEPFNTRETLAALGVAMPEMTDPDALSALSMSGNVEYGAGSIGVKELKADVDGVPVNGNMTLKYGGDKPSLFARLDAGKVDVDRYLPPNRESSDNATEQAAEEVRQPTRIIRSEWLRRLDLDVKAQAEEVTVAKIRLENVATTVKAENGLIRLQPLRSRLYDGTLEGGVTINAQGASPHSTSTTTLTGVDVGALIKDVTGDDQYKGHLDFQGTASFTGEHVPEILGTMAGKVEFEFRNGVFPGVDLIGLTKRTHAKKGKEKGKIEAKEDAATRYGSITGTGRIINGVITNKDLVIKAPGLWVDGEGVTSLSTHEIDYLLKAKLVPLKHDEVESSDDLFGVMVPIRVAGTLENPRYWVSLTEYVKSLGGAVIGVGTSIIGGVFDAITGVGKALSGSGDDEPKK